MKDLDFWLTIKIHSFVIFTITYILYRIFIFLAEIFLNEEERQSINNDEQKPVRFHVVFLILNGLVFKVISIATFTTFIALFVKDLL